MTAEHHCPAKEGEAPPHGYYEIVKKNGKFVRTVWQEWDGKWPNSKNGKPVWSWTKYALYEEIDKKNGWDRTEKMKDIIHSLKNGGSMEVRCVDDEIKELANKQTAEVLFKIIDWLLKGKEGANPKGGEEKRRSGLTSRTYAMIFAMRPDKFGGVSASDVARKLVEAHPTTFCEHVSDFREHFNYVPSATSGGQEKVQSVNTYDSPGLTTPDEQTKFDEDDGDNGS